MALHKQQPVRIINPGDGPRFTTAKKAIKYLREGRAKIAGEYAIELVKADRRHLAVLKSIAGASEENNPAPIHRSAVLEVIPASEGTNDYATFGRYPMFPSTAFKKRAA